eukprot:2062715-Ditylum_brightwellii.AAC.3
MMNSMKKIIIQSIKRKDWSGPVLESKIASLMSENDFSNEDDVKAKSKVASSLVESSKKSLPKSMLKSAKKTKRS